MTRKTYDNLHSFYRNIISSLNQEQRELQKTISKHTRLIEAIQYLTRSPWPNYSIMRLTEKENDILIVAYNATSGIRDARSLELRLTTVNHSKINYDVCRIDASYYINQSLEIIDFVGIKNQGFGSLLMQELIEFCKVSQIPRLWGDLSPVDLQDQEDKEHEARMLHFYSKFGFTIKDSTRIDWKKINLDLKILY